MSWRIALAALALGVMGSLAPASAQVADPALVALAERDAYVSPRVLGVAAAAAEADLAAGAEEMNDARRPVKLAIVLGPFGAPSMQAYVRELRRELRYEGTLVLTAPGRNVVVAGPEPPGLTTRRLRDARVQRIRNPVDKVLTAAAVAAPPPSEPTGGTRAIAGLLALGALGAAWAVAWGLRRERRGRRGELAESRGYLEACIDAARVRAAALGARADLGEEGRSRVDAALVHESDALAHLRAADSTRDVELVLPPLRAALSELAAAGASVGQELSVERPFEGLCGVDPAHGPATNEAPVEGRGVVPVCAACAEAAAGGTLLVRRMIPTPGGPVPFDEMSSDPLRAPAPPEPATTEA
jgi:hypothetical protein